MANPGSVIWAFEKLATGEWKPKFPQTISEDGRQKLFELIAALEEHEDVQNVITNIKIL